ncbi:selenoprotein N [Biomphalaria glabrata]|nr:selenoprotein N [Biomphalaria glabrata]
MVPSKYPTGDKSTQKSILRKNDANQDRGLLQNKEKKFHKWLYWYTPIILSILSIIASWAYLKLNSYGSEKSVSMYTELYGWKVVDLFHTHDKDGDFYLSIEEAVPLLLQILSEGNVTESTDTQPSEDVVTLVARFSPLNISTMMRDWNEDIGTNESFSGLFHWTSPAIPEKVFGVSRFKDLLPDNLRDIPPPGTLYSIVDMGSGHVQDLSSNRFYPPKAQKKGKFLHHLFSMLQEYPFLVTRFDPQGAIGCVRAVSDEYLEVIFRMHIEFQLNDPPSLPFWFTPGQFTGRLTVSRDLTKVLFFNLFVPNNQKVNVDMEWLTDKNDPEVMEVDIGFMPKMEIRSVGYSHKPNSDGQENNDFENTTIVWQKEITYEEAKDALDVRFFPFKKVKYHNLTDAFHLAEKENKLVHTILLWGALDDQSC